jgi:hypothetical protein
MTGKTREQQLLADALVVFNNVRLGDKPNNALLLGAGTATYPVTTATADSNHLEFRLQNSATSGDNRALYLRFYLTGAGGGGEAARIFTTVDDVAAGTAHGAHISLNFDATGSVTGLGVAARATLHVPDDASWAPGTIAAMQAEIYSDGAASDTDGATEVSFLRFVNGGHANGIADVDDDANLLKLDGFTVGAGNVVAAKTAAAVSHTIRCDIGGTTYYLMVSDTQ